MLSRLTGNNAEAHHVAAASHAPARGRISRVANRHLVGGSKILTSKSRYKQKEADAEQEIHLTDGTILKLSSMWPRSELKNRTVFDPQQCLGIYFLLAKSFYFLLAKSFYFLMAKS